MVEEKTYIIPLRRDFLKAPKYKRTKRALTAIKSFVSRHLKAKEVKIGQHLNLELWKNGRKNPPSKLKVKAKKEENIIYVELPEFEFEKKEKKEKKKEPTTLKEKLEEKLTKKEKPEEEKERKLDMSLEKNIKKVTKDSTKKVKETPEKQQN